MAPTTKITTTIEYLDKQIMREFRQAEKGTYRRRECTHTHASHVWHVIKKNTSNQIGNPQQTKKNEFTLIIDNIDLSQKAKNGNWNLRFLVFKIYKIWLGIERLQRRGNLRGFNRTIFSKGISFLCPSLQRGSLRNKGDKFKKIFKLEKAFVFLSYR